MAVCVIAVDNEEMFTEAQALMADMPIGGENNDERKYLPVLVRSAQSEGDEALDQQIAELAQVYNGMVVTSKEKDPSVTELQ